MTDLTLVDGQQVPLQTQLINRSGRTSEGQDAGTIVGTTALGAAIGAVAGRGEGAAIGAGAGAAAGIIGVLLTRGHPTVIYPESVLTFRIDAPITIATDRSPQAFRYMDPRDYDRPAQVQQRRPPPPSLGCGGYGCAPPPPYFYGPAYPYYGYYSSGPGVSLFFGGRACGYRFYGGGRRGRR